MKKLILILIIIILLIGICFFVFSKQANHKGNNLLINFDNNAKVIIRDMTNVPSKYYSGSSRFSQGKCKIDTDCKIQGC